MSAQNQRGAGSDRTFLTIAIIIGLLAVIAAIVGFSYATSQDGDVEGLPVAVRTVSPTTPPINPDDIKPIPGLSSSISLTSQCELVVMMENRSPSDIIVTVNADGHRKSLKVPAGSQTNYWTNYQFAPSEVRILGPDDQYLLATHPDYANVCNRPYTPSDGHVESPSLKDVLPEGAPLT